MHSKARRCPSRPSIRSEGGADFQIGPGIHPDQCVGFVGCQLNSRQLAKVSRPGRGLTTHSCRHHVTVRPPMPGVRRLEGSVAALPWPNLACRPVDEAHAHQERKTATSLGKYAVHPIRPGRWSPQGRQAVWQGWSVCRHSRRRAPRLPIGGQRQDCTSLFCCKACCKGDADSPQVCCAGRRARHSGLRLSRGFSPLVQRGAVGCSWLQQRLLA